MVQPRTITDPTFGRLLWFAARPPHSSYWEGKTKVETRDRELSIEVFLDGDNTGVSENQRAFFAELSHRIPALLEAIVEEAHTMPELSNLTLGELKARWVALPSDPFKMEWEIGLDVEGIPNIHVVASFAGWQVSHIGVED